MPTSRPLLAASLSVLVAFAGCLGTADPASQGSGGASNSGTIEATSKLLPNGAHLDPNLGAVIGQVYNYDNITIRDANVLLAGTSNYTKTDALGRFGFSAIQPGRYTLHVDAPKYVFIEEPIDIAAGEVTQVLVRLAFGVHESIGFREHVHDLWGKDAVKTLFEGPVEMTGSPASGGSDTSVLTCPAYTSGPSTTRAMGVASASMDAPPKKVTNPKCAEQPILLETGVRVLPGTKELRIAASWKESSYVPFVSVRSTNATPIEGIWFKNRQGSDEYGHARETVLSSGQTSHLYLNDTVAQDNGHARWTAWSFVLHVESDVAEIHIPFPDLIRREVGAFTIKIEAIKGVVPADRPHVHFWTDGSKIEVPEFEHQIVASGQTTRDPTWYQGYSDGAHVMLPANVVVPPGTTRIDATMTYVGGRPELDPYWTKKGFSVRTARIDPRYTGLGDLLSPPAITPIANGVTKYSFAIDAENETDTVYQCKEVEAKGGGVSVACTSFWLLLLSNLGSEDASTMTNECGHQCITTFRFRFDFINENWDEDFKAGRI